MGAASAADSLTFAIPQPTRRFAPPAVEEACGRAAGGACDDATAAGLSFGPSLDWRWEIGPLVSCGLFHFQLLEKEIRNVSFK